MREESASSIESRRRGDAGRAAWWWGWSAGTDSIRSWSVMDGEGGRRRVARACHGRRRAREPGGGRRVCRWDCVVLCSFVEGQHEQASGRWGGEGVPREPCAFVRVRRSVKRV